MASDFTLGFDLRPAETNHAAGAQLWFVLGDSATRGNFIRAGVDFGAGQLRLVEGKSGLSAAVPLAVLPQDFASGTLTYQAATRRLDFALGCTNVSLTLGGSYASASTYGCGAAATIKWRRHFRMKAHFSFPIANETGSVADNRSQSTSV